MARRQDRGWPLAHEYPQPHGPGAKGRSDETDPVPSGGRIQRGREQGTGGAAHEVQEHVGRGEAASGVGPEPVDLSLVGDVQSVGPDVEDDNPYHQAHEVIPAGPQWRPGGQQERREHAGTASGHTTV